MPTYVYECRDCGHRFEIFQSFKAEPLHTCPECREAALRKVLFPAGVVFKGAGFYVTDSRRPRSKTSSDKDSKDSKDSKGGKSSDSSKRSSADKVAAKSGAKQDS